MPVLIRFSMPPIAFWQQSGRTCSLNIRILSLNFDYLLTLKCNYNDDIDADGTHHFKNTFKNCSSLMQGMIKVPVGQFETYKANAGIMGTTADRFAKDE